MARIRSIKPEMWTDPTLGRMDAVTRLVWVAIISLADDAGRLPDNERWLDGQMFSHSSDTCGPSLDTLARATRIRRVFAANGDAYIQIVNWEKHQRVDRPRPSVFIPSTQQSPDQPLTEGRADDAPRSRADNPPTRDENAGGSRGEHDLTATEGEGERERDRERDRDQEVERERAHAPDAANASLLQLRELLDREPGAVAICRAWAHVLPPTVRGSYAAIAVMAMQADGLTARQVVEAMEDWIANGQQPSQGSWRQYLRRAKKAADGGGGGVGGTTGRLGGPVPGSSAGEDYRARVQAAADSTRRAIGGGA